MYMYMSTILPLLLLPSWALAIDPFLIAGAFCQAAKYHGSDNRETTVRLNKAQCPQLGEGAKPKRLQGNFILVLAQCGKRK